MKVGEKTFVALTYELVVDGENIQTVTADRPLEFVFGTGFMLPAFESRLEGLEKGDGFAFRLESHEAYGDNPPEAIKELPKEAFMIDGKIEEGMLEIGNRIPMGDNLGNHWVGIVKEVGDDSVTMDFNHELAGKALDFTGKIVEVRESTPADLMMGHHAGGCSCGCGCGEGDDCGDGCGGDHGCGCH